MFILSRSSLSHCRFHYEQQNSSHNPVHSYISTQLRIFRPSPFWTHSFRDRPLSPQKALVLSSPTPSLSPYNSHATTHHISTSSFVSGATQWIWLVRKWAVGNIKYCRIWNRNQSTRRVSWTTALRYLWVDRKFALTALPYYSTSGPQFCRLEQNSTPSRLIYVWDIVASA